MTDTFPFARLILYVAGAGLGALLCTRIAAILRVPAPLLVLVTAATAVKVIPDLSPPSGRDTERLVTVALICILFEGGMQMGWTRFRSAGTTIAVTGVLGTFLTVGTTAVFVHVTFGFTWYVSTLVATAVSPTDPAMVFAVLAGRDIIGRSGTILEGESGANDPVGIALMASLLSAGSLSAGAFGHIAGEFALQLCVGLTVGVLGSWLSPLLLRGLSLTGTGMYPLWTLIGAFVLFGIATLAHGSGFLAVFIAGILIGDQELAHREGIDRFHGALASLGEILAFVVLGLTVDLAVLVRANVWIPGLLIGLVLALVLRPLCVGALLFSTRLSRYERLFISFAGLKGAVPILLGTFVLHAVVPSSGRLYGIVVVVVLFSVLVQGSLIGALATRLRLLAPIHSPD